MLSYCICANFRHYQTQTNCLLSRSLQFAVTASLNNNDLLQNPLCWRAMFARETEYKANQEDLDRYESDYRPICLPS